MSTSYPLHERHINLLGWLIGVPLQRLPLNGQKKLGGSVRRSFNYLYDNNIPRKSQIHDERQEKLVLLDLPKASMTSTMESYSSLLTMDEFKTCGLQHEIIEFLKTCMQPRQQRGREMNHDLQPWIESAFSSAWNISCHFLHLIGSSSSINDIMSIKYP